MSDELTKAEIVRKFNEDRTAGCLMSLAGVVLCGASIGLTIYHEDPMALCLAPIGLAAMRIGMLMRSGARKIWQRDFDHAPNESLE